MNLCGHHYGIIRMIKVRPHGATSAVDINQATSLQSETACVTMNEQGWVPADDSEDGHHLLPTTSGTEEVPNSQDSAMCRIE